VIEESEIDELVRRLVVALENTIKQTTGRLPAVALEKL
jgi:hypothetical protein